MFQLKIYANGRDEAQRRAYDEAHENRIEEQDQTETHIPFARSFNELLDHHKQRDLFFPLISILLDGICSKSTNEEQSGQVL